MKGKENLNYIISVLKTELNVCEEKELLDNLFEMRLEKIENCMKKNKEYNDNLKKIYEKYLYIEENIKDEKLMNYIEEWMCLVNENSTNANEINYKIGLKDGMNIAISVFEDEDN